jgi:hypothetical protein
MMGRIRIGLTGLASVFLVVLLGAAIFSMFGGDRNDNNSVAANSAEMANHAEATEPLAELGLTPNTERRAPR